MGVVKAPEHFLFRAYSKAIKQWLIENCYLSNYPKENNVTIVYSTPDRAWSKYIYPVINGGTTSPNINFVLKETEFLDNENFLGFVKESRIENDKVNIVSPPLVYQLTYSTTIYTRVQSEMDILLYQLLTQANKQKKATFKVDGQWAELMATNPTNEINLEPGETQDKVVRYGLSLIIKRAYLPLEYDVDEMIKSVEFEYDI